MKYETKTLKDVITFDLKVNDYTKLHFPSDYDYWCDVFSRELTRVEWNEVMDKLGFEMVEDMMKVFQKHFKKTYKRMMNDE